MHKKPEKPSFRQYIIKRRISIVPPSYTHRRVNGIDLFVQKIGVFKSAKKQFTFGSCGLSLINDQIRKASNQKIQLEKQSSKEEVRQNVPRDKLQNTIKAPQIIKSNQALDFSTRLSCNDLTTQNFIKSLSCHKDERKDRKKKSFYEPRKARVNDI